jgi:hypothetical protein
MLLREHCLLNFISQSVFFFLGLSVVFWSLQACDDALLFCGVVS